MGEGLIWLTSVGGYLLTGGIMYRQQYIRTFKEWRRWQAEDPTKSEALSSDWDVYHRTRADISYYTYMEHKQSERVPPWWLAPFWVFWAIGFTLRAVLQPKVKVPDYTRIERLENMGD